MQVELRTIVNITELQAEVLDDVMTEEFQKKLTNRMGLFLHKKLNRKLLSKSLEGVKN